MARSQHQAWLFVLLVFLSSCSTHRAPSTPGKGQKYPSVIVQSTLQPSELTAIKAGIEQTMQIYERARNERNKDLLMQVVDDSNSTFRFFVEQRIALADSSADPGTQLHYRVEQVIPKPLGFIQAHIALGEPTFNGLVADYTFRNINGRWRLSEPTVAQLDTKVITTSHFLIQAA